MIDFSKSATLKLLDINTQLLLRLLNYVLLWKNSPISHFWQVLIISHNFWMKPRSEVHNSQITSGSFPGRRSLPIDERLHVNHMSQLSYPNYNPAANVVPHPYIAEAYEQNRNTRRLLLDTAVQPNNKKIKFKGDFADIISLCLYTVRRVVFPDNELRLLIAPQIYSFEIIKGTLKDTKDKRKLGDNLQYQGSCLKERKKTISIGKKTRLDQIIMPCGYSIIEQPNRKTKHNGIYLICVHQQDDKYALLQFNRKDIKTPASGLEQIRKAYTVDKNSKIYHSFCVLDDDEILRNIGIFQQELLYCRGSKDFQNEKPYVITFPGIPNTSISVEVPITINSFDSWALALNPIYKQILSVVTTEIYQDPDMRLKMHCAFRHKNLYFDFPIDLESKIDYRFIYLLLPTQINLILYWTDPRNPKHIIFYPKDCGFAFMEIHDHVRRSRSHSFLKTAAFMDIESPLMSTSRIRSNDSAQNENTSHSLIEAPPPMYNSAPPKRLENLISTKEIPSNFERTDTKVEDNAEGEIIENKSRLNEYEEENNENTVENTNNKTETPDEEPPKRDEILHSYKFRTLDGNTIEIDLPQDVVCVDLYPKITEQLQLGNVISISLFVAGRLISPSETFSDVQIDDEDEIIVTKSKNISDFIPQ